MGEPARYLMVAAVVVTIFAGSRPLSAQGDLGIPNSLTGNSTFDQAAATFRNSNPQATNSQGAAAAPSSTQPTYTGGLQSQRSSAMPGGPSTNPYNASTASGLPSTDPYNTSNASQTKSGGFAFGAPSNAATSQPGRSSQTGRSSQALEIDRAMQGLPPGPGASSTAANTGGFGSLPKGVNLPPNKTGTTSTATNTAPLTSSSTAAANAKTSPQTNWDPSVFNATTAAAPTAKNQPGFATLPDYGKTNAASNATGMSMPGSGNASTTSIEQAQWTAEQVAALAAKFGIKRNDPRLSDPAFVNELYTRYQKYQTDLAKSQLAASANATSRPDRTDAPPTNRWPGPSNTSLPGGSYPRTPVASPNTMTAEQLAATSNQFGLPPTSGAQNDATPRGTTSGGRTSRRDVDPRLSQKDVDGLPPGAWTYDKFGNPIDKYGNILDRFGEPVDDETAYNLTHGKKHRAQQDLLAKQKSENNRLAPRYGAPSSPPLSSESVGGTRSPSDQRSPGMTLAQGRPIKPGEDTRGVGSTTPTADHAGLGGSSTVIGKSNPYVNVFLLCSLVANTFLFVWLQRLWNHHRDLIASTRSAASGISTGE